MVEVSQLWIYPLKSARGIRVDSAKLCLTGFEHDRSFMLVEPKPSKKEPSQTQWHVMTYAASRVNYILTKGIVYGIGPRYASGINLTLKMGLLRTAITTLGGEKILHVWVKDHPDSIDVPLVPR